MKSTFLITLYYSLASIIGLCLTVIGASLLANLILRSYILRIPSYPSIPPQPFDSAPQIEKMEARGISQDDKASLEEWKISYAQWKKEQSAYDQAHVDQKNQLATSLSMLVVGIPVLLFHQKELRRKVV